MTDALLGDYDCQEVTLTLDGKKTGVQIVPSQWGPEARIQISGRDTATETEGQGGGVVISRYHSTLAEMTIEVLSTEPMNPKLDAAIEAKEVFDFAVADNSGTGKCKGKCWIKRRPPWDRAKTAAPVQWVFGCKMESQETGQTNIIA